MQTLVTAAQMRAVDAYTIEQQQLSSIKLMENAAKAFSNIFIKQFPKRDAKISVFCGKGNNGGDGLAIARLLAKAKYKNLNVILINFSDKESDDYAKNLKKLKRTKVAITTVAELYELSDLTCDIVIDGILGAGLNKPLGTNYATLVKLINGLKAKRISIDVPTGFKGEGEIGIHYNGIKADLVICFQRPKLNFFFPESAVALESFKVVDISLEEEFLEAQQSYWKLTTKDDIKQLVKSRPNFSHKGTYGHALLVAGSVTTMGAALLASAACLHAGAGLTTLCLPYSGLNSLNTALPEVMALPRDERMELTVFEKFTAIAIGPGLGVKAANEVLLAELLALKKLMVIDADGLNILANRTDLLSRLPINTILTPHLKEFDRLFGEHQNWWQRLTTAREQAKALKIIIVLKNSYTFICLPNGDIHINPTGNAAMASGGMGDVLTGIITALLAQSYDAKDAAILGVYLHGKAGDELAKTKYCVTASEVALQIPKTIKMILTTPA